MTCRVHRVPFRWGSHSSDACYWRHFTKRLVIIPSLTTLQAPTPTTLCQHDVRNSLKWGQCPILRREMSLTTSCWTYFPFTAVMDFLLKASGRSLWAERLPVGIFLTTSQGSFCFCFVWNPSTHAQTGTPGVRGWRSPEKRPWVGDRPSQKAFFPTKFWNENLKFWDYMETEIQTDILHVAKDQLLNMVLRRPEVDVCLSSWCLGGVF